FGLLFIFLSIFGSGASLISEGFIPTGLENAFRFFLGIWYFVASIILFIIGIYFVLKRKPIRLFTKRSVGFFLLFLGILLFTHIQTFEKLKIDPHDISILKSSFHHFSIYVKGEGVSSQLGGGMIGALSFTLTYFLFSFAGAKIVAVFSILIGILFMTNLSLVKIMEIYNVFLADQLKAIKDKKKNKKEKKKQQEAEEKDTKETPVAVGQDLDVQYSIEESMKPESSQPKTNDTNKQNVNQDQKTSETDEQVDEMPAINALTDSENDKYELPSPSLLTNPVQQSQAKEKSQIQKTVTVLEQTFKRFGVNARITTAHVSPAVTKYEVYREQGVKVSRILTWQDDLALAIAAHDIRIEAPIPGKAAVAIEVPNQTIATV